MKNKMVFQRAMLFTALGILCVMLLMCIWPSLFTKYGTKDIFAAWQSPSKKHILGTNDMGYDIFTELVYAAFSTLFTGIASASAAVAAGTIVGLLCGYANGWLKELLKLLTNIFLLLPTLPMGIVLSAFMGSGTKSIVITLSVLSWSSTARIVRAKTETLIAQNFVKELKILGISKPRILFFHILPNLSEVVFSRFISTVASCILTETTLSFLGLGSPDKATWGAMINFAYKRGGFMREAYAYYLAPGLMIALCVSAFYLLNCYFVSKTGNVEIGEYTTYLD